MASSAMAVVSASRSWIVRDSVRTICPNDRIAHAIGGTTAKMTSESRQFSASINATEPTSVSASRSASPRSLVAADWTFDTSLVRRLVISPVRWSEKKRRPRRWRCV